MNTLQEPRSAVPLIVDALRAVFLEDLTCAILKGSVLKGDWIPYFSDLDVHAFVRGIGPDRTPPWPQAVQFQARIGTLDPEDYRVNAFQVSFVDSDAYPKDWVPPWPGTYEVLQGAPPPAFAQVDRTAHVEHARHNLAALPGWIASLSRSYVDKPDRALPRLVRLAGTFLKGALYDAGILLANDPEPVLTSPLPQLAVRVGDATGCREALAGFYAGATQWRQLRVQNHAMRDMFAVGMTALDAIVRWNGEHAAESRWEWVHRIPTGSMAARAVRKLERIPPEHFAALGVIRTLQGTWFLFACSDELTDEERAEVTSAFDAAGTAADLTVDRLLSLPTEIYCSGPPATILRALRACSIY